MVSAGSKAICGRASVTCASCLATTPKCNNYLRLNDGVVLSYKGRSQMRQLLRFRFRFALQCSGQCSGALPYPTAAHLPTRSALTQTPITPYIGLFTRSPSSFHPPKAKDHIQHHTQSRLDDANLVGHIQGIVVGGQPDIRLLLTVRPVRGSHWVDGVLVSVSGWVDCGPASSSKPSGSLLLHLPSSPHPPSQPTRTG